MKKAFFVPLLFVFLIIAFFNPFFFQGKVPVPADTLIGLYHPFRDLYSNDYPNGIPYKNFLITDPIRQQYPWRWLGITEEKNGELPLWNPYTMTGGPLLATMQGSVFYPLNIIFFVLPFMWGWSLLIILQPLIAGLFLYYYLRNLRLSTIASILGALAFSFSGFAVSWMEWGTIGHVGAWLPLILLAIDKLLIKKKKETFSKNHIILWSSVFVFSFVSAFFAGHLQTFFYLALTALVYFVCRLSQIKYDKKKLFLFVFLFVLFLLITFVQWLPSFQLIGESARDVDLNWHKEGWFIPWQHLIQFIAPDFFGNPATLNYWGVWNYGELVGYVGIIPLIFAFVALFLRRDKRTYFFGILALFSLLFALPTFLAQIPFTLNIPFLSTAQPTRLLYLTDFSLAILAALGLDYYLKTKKKLPVIIVLGFFGFLLTLLWLFIFMGSKHFPTISLENMLTAKRNLYLPTLLLGLSGIALLAGLFIRQKKIKLILVVVLILISCFDLFRFMNKFISFSDTNYLYPTTKILSYLQKQQGQFRIMTTDSQILPPNVSTMYKLQTIDGYDPLYLKRYGELVASINRREPDIHAPFGFNRIIQSVPIDSPYLDLLGVKYILSFSELPKGKFTKVMSEGKTILYENKQVSPRAFFTNKITPASSNQDAMNKLFAKNVNLRQTAIVENWANSQTSYATGTAKIKTYKENRVEITTSNASAGFLVLTDAMYPTWNAFICSSDNKSCQETKIYRTNYNFRGIVVPAGTHHVVFAISLL